MNEYTWFIISLFVIGGMNFTFTQIFKSDEVVCNGCSRTMYLDETMVDDGEVGVSFKCAYCGKNNSQNEDDILVEE